MSTSRPWCVDGATVGSERFSLRDLHPVPVPSKILFKVVNKTSYDEKITLGVNGVRSGGTQMFVLVLCRIELEYRDTY